MSVAEAAENEGQVPAANPWSRRLQQSEELWALGISYYNNNLPRHEAVRLLATSLLIEPNGAGGNPGVKYPSGSCGTATLVFTQDHLANSLAELLDSVAEAQPENGCVHVVRAQLEYTKTFLEVMMRPPPERTSPASKKAFRAGMERAAEHSAKAIAAFKAEIERYPDANVPADSFAAPAVLPAKPEDKVLPPDQLDEPVPARVVVVVADEEWDVWSDAWLTPAMKLAACHAVRGGTVQQLESVGDNGARARALKDHRKALALDPLNGTALVRLASDAREGNRVDEAIELYERFIGHASLGEHALAEACYHAGVLLYKKSTEEMSPRIRELWELGQRAEKEAAKKFGPYPDPDKARATLQLLATGMLKVSASDAETITSKLS